MKSLATSLLGFLLLLSASHASVYAASDSTGSNALPPCVARSPTTGLYYDLNSISLSPPKTKDEKLRGNIRDESWHAKGHDYHANFTINVCAPVVEDIKDVVGVDRARWQNVSAYYEKEGKTYSIGYVVCELWPSESGGTQADLFFLGNKRLSQFSGAVSWF